MSNNHTKTTNNHKKQHDTVQSLNMYISMTVIQTGIYLHMPIAITGQFVTRGSQLSG